ncbi:MAG: hypothetical protein M0Q01_03840 [Syntrophales bacterium]|nr:hypothetical protein [Syntrophales bacterium]
MNQEDKENNAVENNGDKIPKSIKKPSVLEYLGPDWKEYFLKPETIEKIFKTVVKLRRMRTFDKMYSLGKINYEFAEMASITHLGTNRQRIIVLLRDTKSGLIDKWSIDISSTIPLWDQILHALYYADDCTGTLILYFEDLSTREGSKHAIAVEKKAMSNAFEDVFSFTESIYAIQASIVSCDRGNTIEVAFDNYPCLGSRSRKSIPSRISFEGDIWDSYYRSFKNSVFKEDYDSRLVTDSNNHLRKRPFLVMPVWTEEGIFMRLYSVDKFSEITCLNKDIKEELSKRYPECEMEEKKISGIAYCIDIQINNAPITDFIESPTRAKFNYASEIHQQQMALIKHVEEIFQDYVPKSSSSFMGWFSWH